MVNPSPSLSITRIGWGGGHLLPLFFLPLSTTVGAVNADKSINSEEFDMSPCYALEHMKIAARVAQPAEVALLY
jgi:hypothetical protein